MKARVLLLFVVLLASVATAPAQEVDPSKVPDHPNLLRYESLSFEVPDPDDYRHVLDNGIVVYVAEDHKLPLVDISVRLRVGAFLEEKPGVAEMTGTMLRRGGAGGMSAEEFDEKVDFLAVNMNSSGGATDSAAGFNSISPVIDDALELLFQMLRSPGFQEDRLKLEKDNLLEDMKQRNDRPQSISGREWGWLMRGKDTFISHQMTKAEVDAITRDDLVAFHKKWWRPENMTIAVSGDVDAKAVIAKLEERFAGWNPEGPEIPWPPTGPDFTPTPGVYYVEKDIPQGRVVIGHLGKQRESWNDKDEYALLLMNDILGGGGFTSRLMKRIRSDEGLAYGAGSAFSIGEFWPGVFQMVYQSKSPTVALAAKIALEEMKSIQQDGVTEDELKTAKASFIDVFPRRFESAEDIVDVFVDDDVEGRPHDYWDTYRKRIEAVTPKEVQRVARKYLQPDQLVFLIVGEWDAIQKGDPDNRASMAEFFGGEATELPLRDPLTLEPIQD
ncbi:MAG: pitrilysin family protein [Acidobacteriota bacterium]|jgi:predicted Zn-dependent peptidase